MRRKILGVNVDFDLNMDDVVREADRLVKEKDGTHLIATTSPYFIMSAQKDKDFMDIVNSAALSIPDGAGVLYANYYLNEVPKLKNDSIFALKAFIMGISSGIRGIFNSSLLGKQLTGVELTDKLCELSSQKNYTVFLLGGRKRDSIGSGQIDPNYDMATEAAKVIKNKYANVRIIGASSAFNRTIDDDQASIDYIHSCMTNNNVNNLDILLVAYNPIQQEKWIQRNAKDIPATVCVGVGRTFDYISGYLKPIPNIYERMHLGWLYILIRQLWRIKRVAMSFPIFPIKVYLESLKR